MKPNFASLLYKPKNNVGIAQDKDGYSLCFTVGNDHWEAVSISLNRQSVVLGKLIPGYKDRWGNSRDVEWKPVKKLTGDQGLAANSWRGGLTKIVTVTSVEKYKEFWGNILRMTKPRFFGARPIESIGMLNGDPVLMYADEGGHYIVNSGRDLHVATTVRGTSIKQKYLYQDGADAMSIPMGYILATLDKDYDRFADPFDENPNKTLQKEVHKRLLTIHWDETYKEE